MKVWKKLKKWSAGVIFKSGKCYLDKDVLSMAINAKQKKDNEFVEKISKLYNEFIDKKNDYNKAIQQIESLTSRDENDIPIKLLKPVCSYKKRKGDKAMPTKRNELIERYVSTKSRPDMELEEWLRTKTSLFSRYKRDNGCDLTMEMVHQVIDKLKPRQKLNFDDIEKVSV